MELVCKNTLQLHHLGLSLLSEKRMHTAKGPALWSVVIFFCLFFLNNDHVHVKDVSCDAARVNFH